MFSTPGKFTKFDHDNEFAAMDGRGRISPSTCSSAETASTSGSALSLAESTDSRINPVDGGDGGVMNFNQMEISQISTKPPIEIRSEIEKLSNIHNHLQHHHNHPYIQSPPLPIKPESSSQTGKSELTWKVALAAGVSFLTNSLPSGFNMGVVNTPEEIFKEFFNNTLNGNQIPGNTMINNQQIEMLWSFAVSLLLVGAFIGCTFTGYLADTIGRRGLLTLNALVGLLGVSLCWLSKFLPSVWVFMAGRFIAGLHTGVGSSLVPMYMFEIAPASLATSLGTLHVMGMNGGQMIAMILGLEPILGTYSRWQLLFFVNSVFIILGLTVILLCPESPVYLLVMKQKDERAIQTLQMIRGGHPNERNDVISRDFAILRLERKNKEMNNNRSIIRLLLTNPSFRTSLLVVCVLHAGQQLIGINAVFYYSTKTFRSVGLSARTSQYSSIGCTALNTVSALLSIPMIRRFASRRLLLVSSMATATSLVILTLSMTFNHYFEWLNYVTIAIILIFVYAFAFGLGPIPYMIGGELFEQSTMAIGMSIGCFVNWFCNFLIAITFPLVVLVINQFVFLIFIFFNVLLLAFIYFRVPDTRNCSSKESNTNVSTTIATIGSQCKCEH